MSRGFLIALVLIAGAAFYFYKANWFHDINAELDYTPDGVTVIAREMDFHDCKLSLTNDFTAEIPLVRRNQQVTISKYDFKQWNKTVLEAISDLGPQIEFRLRCKEGKFERDESNRYLKAGPEKKASDSDSGEVTESN